MHDISELSRESLIEVVSEAVPLSTVRSVYCVGSLAAGLGTARSDVDLYVFADEAQRVPVMKKVQGRKVDIEVRSTGWLAEQLVWFNDRTNYFLDAMSRPRAHHDTLARFWYAVEVLHDAEHASLLKDFHDNPAHCAEVLAGEQLFLSLGILEDLVGFIEDNDEVSASLQARVLLARTTQAYLCSQYSFYLGDKWIAQKLRALLADRPGDTAAGAAWGLMSDASGSVMEVVAVSSCLAAAACEAILNPGDRSRKFDLARVRSLGSLPMLLDWGMAGIGTIDNKRFQISVDVLRAWQDPASNPALEQKLVKLGLLGS